ncbi:MAG TPA: hypothetical protein VG294_18140 [Solirubrobacteraceae bacterium]|jgi:hypothetical protein|nr:hypothetical protein [Solirubrobacteraceae bacterium]
MEPTKPPKRNNYFYGQLLTAEDLARDQEYFRERLRRHNRALHGSGVVYGLDLEVAPDQGSSSPATLTVSPGYALSPRGEEILVGELLSRPVTCAADRCLVAVRYDERLVDPVPGMGVAPGDDETRFEAIEETYVVDVFEDVLPAPEDQWVVLGEVICDPTGQVIVDSTARRHAERCG